MTKDEKIAALERQVQEQRIIIDHLANIERLLRIMPELIATVFLIEKEKVDRIHYRGKSCADYATLPSFDER